LHTDDNLTKADLIYILIKI